MRNESASNDAPDESDEPPKDTDPDSENASETNAPGAPDESLPQDGGTDESASNDAPNETGGEDKDAAPPRTNESGVHVAANSGETNEWYTPPELSGEDAHAALKAKDKRPPAEAHR